LSQKLGEPKPKTVGVRPILIPDSGDRSHWCQHAHHRGTSSAAVYLA